MGNYVMEARKVALQVIAAILESLGLDQGYLRDKFDCGMQVIATNFYPQCFERNLEVGLDSHSDYGFITIILQNCEGLQVKNPKEEKWRAVPYNEDALHVHIGDYMEVLSNGQYKSLVHRALLNPEKKRISIASIHNLSMDEKVAPANDLVEELNPMRYKDNSFRDFLNYLSTEDCKKSKRYIEHLNILGE
ncbi:uncharacterized protein A4U43_C08F2950 [Asparagus officinalis]|nr:uncharacterized protein A4U43_C08F2950 [Asparagus officinalis]